MSTAGTLRIAARIEDGRCLAARIENSRPRAAGLLVGRSVDEALRLVPALFSLCGRAQGIAARAAVGAARGEPYLPSAEDERAVSCEAAQEHLWRLLLDWPVRFGRLPQRTRFAQLHHRLSKVSDAGTAFDIGGVLLDFVAKELLSGFFLSMREPASLAEFISATRYGGLVGETLAELIEAGRWTPANDRVAPLLVAHAAADWARMFGGGMPDEDFDRAPAWRDESGAAAHETGALARQCRSPLVASLLGYGHRIAARVFAQVVDLSDDASRLRHPLARDMQACVDAAALGEGAGLACVETSRGVLLHAVRLEGDIVADYRIIAPTEWNFAPAGAFLCEATGWEAESREAALARLDWLALSLDPCVAFEVVAEDAGDA
ncbi:nickel-dependent hydrogenase large subunit [Azoarcus sp. L1K30]|uniref:nickel-dependent hydrogenase large subunit n=1 Tax=Azoarcus sp. L1K30 TaxID=2820277 RepID=UPI001B81E384|nr:nickel-dependent hydrogenase large subunit [Azoarcus sp. L1K30]MBR0566142.1 nickel-dependent hydrogenase large subunit [Azoarcus sp. L1K30]